MLSIVATNDIENRPQKFGIRTSHDWGTRIMAMTRRHFLWVFKRLIGAASVDALLSRRLMRLVETLSRPIQQYYRNSLYGPIPPKFASEMFPRKSILKCEVGASHATVRGLHPDNLLTGKAIGDALQLQFDYGRTRADRSGTVLAIGSPTSDSLAREVFGFGDESPWPPPNPWELPITYDHHDTGQLDLVRWLASREHRSRRRGIYLTGSKKSMLVQSNPKDNLQLDDYLLVTVLPNYWDKSSALLKGKIWCIGGVHGMGTVAFTQIFSNKKMADDFIDLVKSSQYFQALYYVSEVLHDDNNRISLPRQLELMRLFPLDEKKYFTRAIALAEKGVP